MKFRTLLGPLTIIFCLGPGLPALQAQTLQAPTTIIPRPDVIALKPDLASLRPTNLLPADATEKVRFVNNKAAAKPAALTRLKAGNVPVFRVENFERTERSYEVETSILTEKAVKAGDVCLARFMVRSPFARQESGEGILDCYFQQSSEPFQKSLSLQVKAGPEWRAYEIPFVAKFDSPAGTSAFCFAYGSQAQVLEIAAPEVFDFESRTTVEKLPITRFTYFGREANAPWRTQALERIERIRTAPLKLIVTDANGQPVEGARVEARLVQPAFAFGSAVSVGLIDSQTTESQVYRDKVVELFDTVTIDNGLKWPLWMNATGREKAMRAIDWINGEGLRLRGHNLVWPGMQFSPNFIKKIPDPAFEIPRRIEAHIEDEVTATKGKVWGWDVLNEPLHERDYYEHFPETKSADWFKQARKLDPNALLFVNEYAMLNSGTSPNFIGRYLKFIAMLKENGAPLDGIGVQGHIGVQVRNPTDVLSDLDLLQTAGLPVQITEFDVDTADEELQGDYTRDFLIACYSHPAVTGFINWGFWESQHWKPKAAMYRSDWSEKPNGKAWRELVLDKWRTHIDTVSDTNGIVVSRGHLGTYEITVTKGKSVLRHMLQLTQDKTESRLMLP